MNVALLYTRLQQSHVDHEGLPADPAQQAQQTSLPGYIFCSWAVGPAQVRAIADPRQVDPVGG